METQEQEINLSDLFYLLLSKLHYIILLGIIGTIFGFSVAKFILPEKYTSSVSIYVSNTGDINSQQNQGTIDQTTINSSRMIAATYIVILNDDIVYEQVSDYLLTQFELSDLEKVFTVEYDDDTLTIPPEQIRSLVSIESINETEVISITATTVNPELSAKICTYIAQVAPDLLTRVTKAGSVETVGTAKIPDTPSSPNVKMITIVGLLAGVVLAMAIIIISDILDNRVKVSDDFKKKFEDIPVLAEIPDLFESEKGGMKYEYR